MKTGDKLICKGGSLLEKGKIYFFDHQDIWDDDIIYVKDDDNFIYFSPKNDFYTIKEARKYKLKKIKKLYDTKKY